MIGSWILQLLISIQVVQYGISADKLGCLFSPDLCSSSEFCFNDSLFGTCQDVYKEANFYQYKLDTAGLQQLEGEIYQLIVNGFKWEDGYTQCVLQSLLHALRWRQLYNRELCNDRSPPLADNFLNYLQKYASDDEDRFRKYKTDPKDLSNYELNDLLVSLQNLEDAKSNGLITSDDDDLDQVSQVLSAVKDKLSGDETDRQEEEELRDKKEWTHSPGGSSDVPKKDGPALLPEEKTTSTPHLVTAVFINKKANNPPAVDLMITSMPEIDPNADPGSFGVVDAKYTYIVFKDKLNEHKGRHFVEVFEKLLDVDSGTFTDIRVTDYQVTFLVNPNRQNLNGSAVAALAMSHKDELRKLGYVLESAGVGKETTISLVEDNDSHFFVVTFVLCGCIAAGLLAVVVLYVVRRHARSQAKLQNLSGDNDAEASKDYQDLCRQRMACKSSDKAEPVHVAQRVSSLSQSEASVRSPSSRSSTSSWSEEPAVSNMDISTGHMVLAYMEDHLKTKDRLDQEWAALCAYEAEPSAVSVGSLIENKDKNRFPELLPYDHSRVILNNTSNASGSEYVNANTITDHDPRNPAYIATQGPLPTTVADFWQMIWEQGSVVIVMLTRLTENGVAMCHRYWPEEGSELSHIYEIHLVSEHIWCDDYLVRSFYLKNLKTNETRTVTQFHFLSWPEMGVPASPKALLDFRRKVNKSYRGRSCPIVVHCSDGAGRTGTYCLIDMVLSRMAKGAKEIDIAATLEHIRDQRAGMVRTKEQFEFVLMAVAEEVHAILKALPQ